MKIPEEMQVQAYATAIVLLLIVGFFVCLNLLTPKKKPFNEWLERQKQIVEIEKKVGHYNLLLIHGRDGDLGITYEGCIEWNGQVIDCDIGLAESLYNTFPTRQ